jgi:magnesium transporter
MTDLNLGSPERIHSTDAGALDELIREVSRRAPLDGMTLLESHPDTIVGAVLSRLTPSLALTVLANFSDERQPRIAGELPDLTRAQWNRNQQYPEDSVGRAMEPPVGMLAAGLTAAEAVTQLRQLDKDHHITYGYVTDSQERLLGVLVIKDLLFAEPDELLDSIMLRQPFFLDPESSVLDAMHDVVHRHYPVYPVCDPEGRLIGLVRGYALFELNAVRITATMGRVVGVHEEERLATPWPGSFRMRHPWLQLNLGTAFLAALVVGYFENTIELIVVLAVFLPVLAGQSGNTGCQSLAITLREMALGELVGEDTKRLLLKEAWLGLLNGILTGLTAGLGMVAYAMFTGNNNAWILGLVVLLAMAASCAVSGIAGAFVPLALRRLGADPATASSIFLTTATDVVSMGLFLGLATIILL